MARQVEEGKVGPDSRARRNVQLDGNNAMGPCSMIQAHTRHKRVLPQGSIGNRMATMTTMRRLAVATTLLISMAGDPCAGHTTLEAEARPRSLIG